MPIKITPVKTSVPLARYYQNWKFVYVDSGGNEQTIGGTGTEDGYRVISASGTLRSLRYGVGNFSMLLYNNDAYFNQILQKATLIRCYADHTDPASAPTNKVFDGRITSIKYALSPDNNRYMIVYGINAPQLARRHITISFTNAQARNALISLIDTFFSGIFTYNNVSTSMTRSVTGEYINQLAIDVISDILKQAGYDGYIDFDSDIHTWAEGTNFNSVESIVYGDNMMAYNEVGQDFIDERNRITVYGGGNENTMLVRTKDNTALQAESWISSDVITASNLTTISAVDQKASVELLFREQTPLRGQLNAWAGLPTLLPAQSLKCSDQYANMNQNENAVSIVHNFYTTGEWITSVEINRIDRSVDTDVRDTQQVVSNINTQNINGMTNTILLFTFEDTTNISSLGGLQLTNSQLSIATGSQGTLTSTVQVLDENISSIEVRGTPNDDCAASYFQISADGGRTGLGTSDTQYNLIGDLNTLFSVTAGSNVVVTITLVATATYLLPILDNFVLLGRS